jgi:hypothetical protein
MARTSKNDPSTQAPSSYCILDTRVPGNQENGSPLRKRINAIQEGFFKSCVARLGGFQFVECFTTVDVTGNPSDHPESCEATFTVTYTCKPTSSGAIKSLQIHGGVPYPEPAIPAI